MRDVVYAGVRWTGAIALFALSLLAVVYGATRLTVAIAKLGVPEAELMPFVAIIDVVLAWSYGAILLAGGMAAVRGGWVISTVGLVVAGSIALGAGFWLVDRLATGSAASFVVGAVALAAAFLGVLFRALDPRRSD